MIRTIAFRNICRNKLRSVVVIISIALGIFGGLAVLSTAKGLAKMRQDGAIKSYVSHIQIHNPNYLEYGELKNTISKSDQLLRELSQDQNIKAFAPRVKVESFAQSARGSSGFILNGIYPESEKKVTILNTLCREGNFLDKFKRKPPIIISSKQAETLNVDVKSTIQCSFNDIDGNPVTAGFKVVDIYTSSNLLYDQVNAFIRYEDIASLSGVTAPHQVAVILNNEKDVTQKTQNLKVKYPNLDVLSWRSIAPELGYADKMMDLVMTIFLVIIMLALAFGIINTMLMSVLERKKELGMLLSVGMNKKKVFWMIVWESIYLALIAGPVGIVTAYLAISLFQNIGINLSFAAKGLNSVGLSSIIYPYLDSKYYIIIAILVLVTALLSCIYPAKKALELNPSETLRTSV